MTLEKIAHWPSAFQRRHDALGLARQARLAVILISVDILVVLITLATAWDQQWSRGLELQDSQGIRWLGALTSLLLVLSANLGGLADWLFATLAGTPDSRRDHLTFDRYRPFIFYPAVYFNIALLVAFVHLTGGLVGSPYTSVLYAFFLAAQQFSRFTRQSAYYLVTAVICSIVLLTWDHLSPIRLQNQPPPQLILCLTVGSFAFAALAGQVSKQSNPRSARASKQPATASLYRDPEGRWRFALFSRTSALDAVIPGQAIPYASMSPGEAMKQVGEIAAIMACSLDPIVTTWSADVFRDDCFTCHFELSSPSPGVNGETQDAQKVEESGT